MRVAFVIAPPRESPHAEPPAPVVELRERLALAGFNVVNLATTTRLASQVADAAAMAGADDAVLLYLAGSTRLDDDGGVKLAARAGDDPRDDAVPLAALGEVLRAQGPREVFYFVDALHDGMADDVMRAAEHVDAIATALGVRESGHGLVVGAHAAANAADAWPLTRFYLELMGEAALRDERGDLLASRVHERVRADDALRGKMPGFALLKGASDFVLDAAPIPVPTPSRRPPPSSMRPPPSAEAHRSMRPIALPALDPILLAAADARERKEWDEALDEYKRALMVVAPDDAAAKASIYAYVGEVKRAQNKPREAELNFEKALREAPGHRRSLEALVALATDAKEWRRAVDHRRALAKVIDEPRRRAAELARIATLCEKELGDKDAAARALEDARELTPNDAGILHKLRELYEAAGAWSKVAEVLGALCEGELPGPHARAELRFAQADVVLARLRDEARGLDLLEKTLSDDPAHDKALVALAAVRARREEHAELERALLGVVEKLVQRGDMERAADACKRVAVLRRDRRHDRDGAIEAYRAALNCKPGDADARALLAELLVSKGELDDATRELEAVSRFSPTRAATYKRLFELHARAQRPDRQWLAAAALAELGAADVDHELALEQFKATAGSLRPSAPLDDDAWKKLAAPGVDDAVGAVLRALLPAAVPMKLAELTAAKKLVELDPSKKQPPTSTATVVRSFAWTSQVLGVELPELYVLDDVPGGVAAVQSRAPATALGPAVLSGLGVQALAFVAARHLTYYRPEHYALVFYPSIAELSVLVLAALKVVSPKLAASKPIAEASKRLAKELERVEGARATLEEAARALDARGTMDLGAYVRGVELTAHRAGLLVAADLGVAMRQMNGETRRIADLSLADKRGDLLACCASASFSELRGRLGIAARAS